jgi:hypothetical protein
MCAFHPLDPPGNIGRDLRIASHPGGVAARLDTIRRGCQTYCARKADRNALVEALDFLDCGGLNRRRQSIALRNKWDLEGTLSITGMKAVSHTAGMEYKERVL